MKKKRTKKNNCPKVLKNQKKKNKKNKKMKKSYKKRKIIILNYLMN